MSMCVGSLTTRLHLAVLRAKEAALQDLVYTYTQITVVASTVSPLVPVRSSLYEPTQYIRVRCRVYLLSTLSRRLCNETSMTAAWH